LMRRAVTGHGERGSETRDDSDDAHISHRYLRVARGCEAEARALAPSRIAESGLDTALEHDVAGLACAVAAQRRALANDDGFEDVGGLIVEQSRFDTIWRRQLEHDAARR